MKNREKKQIIEFLLKNNILISPDLLEEDIKKEELLGMIKQKTDKETFLVLNKELEKIFKQKQKVDVDWLELEKSRVLYEKKKDKKVYEKFIEYLKEKQEQPPKKEPDDIEILSSYKEEPKQRDIQDFVVFFNNRYKKLEEILRNRQELQNLISINRLSGKKERETMSIIGLVADKHTTKNNNILLSLEDPSGQTNVLVNKNKPDLFKEAKDIVLDEVIGVIGVNGDNIIFANNILWPEIMAKPIKRSDEEEYCIFLSDFHVGSDNFLQENLERFLQWINGNLGNKEQKNIVNKIKYIFIVGDLIDGCGIYPSQEEELVIKDIYKQYEECARLLKKIPETIKIIICPGNHDAMRIAEPQPELYKDLAKPLWDLKNVIMVSNPSLLRIGKKQNFPGFDVLLYHGYSFDFFVANVDSIRFGGGYDRADLIMKFLLKRRHLAPTHTSTLYIPDTKKDPLVIEQAPDFFVTGHIHKTAVANYRNITMICGSCWQSTTPFQEKVGHHPEPCRVPIVNLQTRKIRILRF